MKRAALLLSTTITLVLAGCASTGGLQPEVAQRDADQLAVARSLEGVNISAADFPAERWWQSFGDRQLDALVDEALAGSPSLDIAQARVRQAMAQAGVVDAARKPTLDASARYTGLLIPETVAPEPLGGNFQGIVLLGLSFNWKPDLWGGQQARWEAALGQARAVEVDAQAARLALAGNVVHAYVALAQAFDALEVAQAEAARSEALAKLSRQRVAAGLDNQAAMKIAETRTASAVQQTHAATLAIDTARNALAALLGHGPDRGQAIARPTLSQLPAPALPSQLPSELLGRRPDVVAARWRVEAAARGIDASRADFYPNVNLSALVGLASAGLSDLIGSNALLTQGGPVISMPILDGGRLRNQLARSDAEFDIAAATYNQTLVTALREVIDAVRAAQSLDAQIAQAEQAHKAAQSAWDISTQRHRAGLGTQIDVLAAQAPLLQIDQQLALLRAQRREATVDLNRALGGGLQPMPPTSDVAHEATP